jgi:NAD+ diphosphatase
MPTAESSPSFVPLVADPGGSVAVRYVHVIGAAVWEHDEPSGEGWERHFLGVLDDVAVWAVDVPHGEDPADGAAVDLYRYFGIADATRWSVAGRAVQIVEWARTHRFCGRCATPTEPMPGERAMRCPACGLAAFPRVAPAMITLVTRGEPGPQQEALLARGAQWPGGMYSCLAGFVEPGETLEDAVRREVREEVGVGVGAVHYVASQPWPFPHSLMVGFRAEYESGELTPDPREIADAGWFTRDALPNLPGEISIARKLIDGWRAEA